MVKYYDSIPDFLFPWIEKQKVFWVATAPLTGNGFVNVSPKGMTGSFHIVNANKVWYEDLTGSGIETVSHVRENGRITILFNAFEGPPRICRLYGKGTVHEFGTPEYDRLLPLEKRRVGSRSVIMLDVFKVATSCGYAVPFMEYKGERNRLVVQISKYEALDIAAEQTLDLTSPSSEPPRPEAGLKHYWSLKNAVSLDGLPGMLVGHHSRKTFVAPAQQHTQSKRELQEEAGLEKTLRTGTGSLKLFAAFLTGIVLTTSYFKYMKPRGW